MGVNLIFKIAAVGILVSVICQVLKHSGREDGTQRAGAVFLRSRVRFSCGWQSVWRSRETRRFL